MQEQIKERWNTLIVIGINEGHNSTACVSQDGKILTVISEERITRKKNEYGFPSRAIEKCLEIVGIKKEDVDQVAIATKEVAPYYMVTKRNTSFSIKDFIREQKEYWYPKIYEGKEVDFLTVFNDRDFRDELPYDFSSVKDYSDAEAFLSIRISNAAKYFGLSEEKILVYDHHACHAAYGYYASPFREMDLLVYTADGGGDGTSGTVSMVRNGDLQEIHRCKYCNLGRIYRYVTLILGMKMTEHEYKVMGMAPYAKDYITAEPYSVIAETIQNDGLDFNYKVKPKDHYFYYKERLDGCRFDGIACAVQTRLEELLVGWVKAGIDQTGIQNILLSGGVAMNVKANKMISEIDEVKNIFVAPSSGDESTAIGAAYLLSSEFIQKDKIQPLDNAYLGHEFNNNDILNALKELDSNNKFSIQEGITEGEIAGILAKGEIVARLAGRMEFGARALGNRSIIANPKSIETIRIINEMIKGRDFWMPFAPSILKEREADYIVNPKGLAAPFMTMAFDSTHLAREELKGAIHPYDFTIRPQLVEKEINPGYWKIIKAFENLTGIGALLNTSFNLHGEPVVASPEDAIRTFRESGLEYLLMNNILVKKRKAHPE